MWQRFVVDTVLEGKHSVIRMDTLSRLFKKEYPKGLFPRRPQRFFDFITNYFHLGEHKLGEWKKDAEGYLIEVNELFVNETAPIEEVNEEDFEDIFEGEEETEEEEIDL